jgi:dolichyl-phosphate-mannose-protein mannosyltransferase
MNSRQTLRRWHPELLLLTLAALITRLWNLGMPKSVVFDEVYFKVYAGDYLTGSYYFDPHPPLGKLLLGAWAKLFHLNAAALTSTTTPVTDLRYLPAIAGALIISVFYIMLRQLKASRRVATLGATLLLLDNALLVESRFILIDSMLILFGLSAATAYLWARNHADWQRWSGIVLAGFLAGLACSTKLTGLACLGIILIAWFIEIRDWRTIWKRWLGEGAILVIIPALVYLSVFWIHFSLLPRTGQGDAFMPANFQQTLIGDPNYNPQVHLSFWTKFTELNVEMQQAEASLAHATHPYGSKWYSWPLMVRGVYYWEGNALTNGTQGNIYLLGNPLIWWGILFIGAIIVSQWDHLRQRLQPYYYGILFLFGAYLINWLPFSQIIRVMFLYHYFYALCFSLALVVLLMGAAAGWMGHDEKFWHFPSIISRNLYIGVLVVALLGFLYFSPLSYGTPLSPAALQQHMWLKTWR